MARKKQSGKNKRFHSRDYEILLSYIRAFNNYERLIQYMNKVYALSISGQLTEMGRCPNEILNKLIFVKGVREESVIELEKSCSTTLKDYKIDKGEKILVNTGTEMYLLTYMGQREQVSIEQLMVAKLFDGSDYKSNVLQEGVHNLPFASGGILKRIGFIQ